MIRKIIGGIIALVGFIVCCWGLLVFAMSIYYNAAKTPHMGDAAYLGFYYGLAIIVIGAIPLMIGILLVKDPQAFLRGVQLSKQHIVIIWLTIILAIVFFGLGSKVYVIREDDKICQTYHAGTIYGYPIGGQIGTYEKVSPSDKYTPRRLLTKSEKGIASVRFIAPYKNTLVVAALLIGFFAFIITKNSKKK